MPTYKIHCKDWLLGSILQFLLTWKILLMLRGATCVSKGCRTGHSVFVKHFKDEGAGWKEWELLVAQNESHMSTKYFRIQRPSSWKILHALNVIAGAGWKFFIRKFFGQKMFRNRNVSQKDRSQNVSDFHWKPENWPFWLLKTNTTKVFHFAKLKNVREKCKDQNKKNCSFLLNF